MAAKTGTRMRIQKTASLNRPFTAAANEEVVIPDIGMRIRTITVSQEYAGHAFEEYGDEFKAVAEIELEGHTKIYTTEWYLRQDPPGLAWTVGSHEIHILGCRTGRLYKNRGLVLNVFTQGG
jgi:hypothetical protein